MNRLPLLILLAAPVAVAQLPSNSRNEASPHQTFRVPLKITIGTMQSIGVTSAIKDDGAGQLRAILPGDLEARIERAPTPLAGVVVHLPNTKPSSMTLLQDQDSLVEIKRSVGELSSVPYLIGYRRWERGGEVHEDLSWRPVYHARGKLKLPNCEMGLMVLDFNGDGVFDRRDHRQATTLGLDVNNDGVLFGVTEYRKLEEIVDVCGLPLQVSQLDPTGLSITFHVSDLTVPAVNSPVPPFSVTTTQGQLIRSSDFRTKLHVLDFWASWCAPCVAKLTAMESLAREYTKELRVIGINVDEPERRSTAEQLIREKALSFPQIVRAQGERDFLWKMFGSMQGVRLSIPLYVVIDGQGMIRYAANGGEDLADLKRVLQEFLKPTSK
jgi:peroxiredoxin